MADTVAEDWADAVVPPKGGKGSEGSKRSRSKVKSKGPTKERLTVHVPVELIDRLRNAIYYSPSYVTLADVAEDGLTAAVVKLEKKHNGGKPFPKRKAELKGGRPVGR